jgi:glycosyltransferase involved in cell wall biosynthesis
MRNQRKGLISNPNLAPYIKESVLAYQEGGILDSFYTGVCIPQSLQKYLSLLPEAWQKNLNRRAFEELKPSHLKTSPFREGLRILVQKYGSTKLADYIWEWAEKAFDKAVAGKLQAENLFFHGYEHASFDSLKKAKQLGVKSFYEQPSQHHQYFSKIVEVQMALYPELKNEASRLLNDEKAVRRNERRDAELLLSDYIICNSTFTQNTLLDAGIPLAKILVIPYGFPAISPIIPKKSSTLRFIYAGNLSLRKGIHLLLQAWKLLAEDVDAELILMGSVQLPALIFKELPKNIQLIPNLPYQKAQDLIKSCDVLVLPTLADGFGMVISESMAAGVPVITTEASAGPDLIEHLKDGLLIESGNVNTIYDALNWCLNHPDELPRMGLMAQKKADLYPWEAYRKKLVDAVKEKIYG